MSGTKTQQMDGNPVLAFWNYFSAPVPKDMVNAFIEKMREKSSPSMYLSFFCDARSTDAGVIRTVENVKDVAIHHASPVSMVERLCIEMCKLTGFYDEPGWIVLVADADSYGCTLNSLSREGWKVMIAHPNTNEWSFFDYADETYSINELIDCDTQQMQPVMDARAFLLQVPNVSPTQLSILLSIEQQCVYMNQHTKEAVIVVEAENGEKIQRSLELLIGRICAAAGVQPSDVLPFPGNQTATRNAVALQCSTAAPLHNGALMAAVTAASVAQAPAVVSSTPQMMVSVPPQPQSPSPGNAASSVAAPASTVVPVAAPQTFAGALQGSNSTSSRPAVYLHSSPDSDRIMSQNEYGMKQDFTIPPPGYDSPRGGRGGKSMSDAEDRTERLEKLERTEKETDADKDDNKGRMNAFGENPWKKAEERFRRRAWQMQQSTLGTSSHRDGMMGDDCTPTTPTTTTGGGENDGHISRVQRLRNEFVQQQQQHQQQHQQQQALMMERKQQAQQQQQQCQQQNSQQSRDRFRKPAPQCVFWENRRHRQETGCTLWHPRESCRFYPTCAHQAQECGFAHPFCGLKCHCPPDKRNPQMNHWTEQLQRAFGIPSASN